LRDGKKVVDLALNETNENEIISFMTGKAMEEVKKILEEKSVSNKVSLEVENLETEKVHNISFKLYKGEILGLFGAEGAGQEEIARSIFGLLPKRGIIKMESEEIEIHNTKEAVKKGIGCILREPNENLITTFTVAENITLPTIDNFSPLGLVKKSLEENNAKQKIQEFTIKTRGPNAILSTLSGGNRQKVAFAKLSNFPLKVLILDYPTMGIDIQAKSEIYRLLKNIASQGTAILLITPEYEEIKMLCDRVLVIQGGHLKANLKVEEIDENILLKWAIGSSLTESGVV
jgi:ribose transport system ATP-binding protein